MTLNDVLIEDVLGDFGFRVAWTADEDLATVQVYEIAVRTESDEPLFVMRGWVALPEDVTPNLAGASPYLEGTIKWDGCMDLTYLSVQMCSADDYRKHVLLLQYLFVRAFELMKREPRHAWPEAESSREQWHTKPVQVFPAAPPRSG
jgi:hypothetical protein